MNNKDNPHENEIKEINQEKDTTKALPEPERLNEQRRWLEAIQDCV